MGWFSRVVKAVATGGYSEYKRQKKKKAEAERQEKKQMAALQAQEARANAQADQQTNRNRQESADLGSLTEQMDASAGIDGILTTPEGLVPDKRKLNQKKVLGG